MAGLFVLGWLLARKKQKNCASFIDVVNDGGKKFCGTRYCFCCQMDMVVG